MDRRSALKWLSRILGAFSTCLVAVPGFGFLKEALRNRQRDSALVGRVARLKDLVAGQPFQAPIVGSRRDAWTVYPDEILGRVWLVRGEGQGPTATVKAFSAVCPHLGCTIQLDRGGERFTCPCHRAAFLRDGAKVSDQELGHRNHSPRGMDELECQLVQDAATQEWWVEVKYQRFVEGSTQRVVAG